MTPTEVQLDMARAERIGFDEAILCARKSDAQLATIMDELLKSDTSALMTRLEVDVYERFLSKHQQVLDYDAVSHTAFYNWTAPQPGRFLPVAVVSAGTSDMPQAAEVIRTLTYLGVPSDQYIDIGVAGLWRLLERVDTLQKYPAIVAVAGMDGALPSVLGGLVAGSLICLPTSTGYGASRGGETALSAALASCAPGLTVVNIDNGYGAACAAFRIVNMIRAYAPHASSR
jgi:NCAIR mutase (PurE)-related protein